MILFLFSAFPRQWLHDIFAGHVDRISRVIDDRNDHITIAGFSCDCNSVVVSSPFISYQQCMLSPVVREYSSFITQISTPVIAATSLSYSLRGPPFLG